MAHWLQFGDQCCLETYVYAHGGWVHLGFSKYTQEGGTAMSENGTTIARLVENLGLQALIFDLERVSGTTEKVRRPTPIDFPEIRVFG